jgi:hypothetical protein
MIHLLGGENDKLVDSFRDGYPRVDDRLACVDFCRPIDDTARQSDIDPCSNRGRQREPARLEFAAADPLPKEANSYFIGIFGSILVLGLLNYKPPTNS